MVLEDHERQGKKFFPPLSKLTGMAEINFADDILPEIIWMGFILNRMGHKKGVLMISDVVKYASSLYEGEDVPDFTFISSFLLQKDSDKKKMCSEFENKGFLDDLRKSLEPFLKCYPSDNPLNFLFQRNRI